MSFAWRELVGAREVAEALRLDPAASSFSPVYEFQPDTRSTYFVDPDARLGMPSGVVLATGPPRHIYSVTSGTPQFPGSPGDAMLEAAFPAYGRTYDATIFEMVFEGPDTLLMAAAFGTHEWPTYTNTFIDNWALWVNGVLVAANSVQDFSSADVIDNRTRQAVPWSVLKGFTPPVRRNITLPSGRAVVRFAVANRRDRNFHSATFLNFALASKSPPPTIIVRLPSGRARGLSQVRGTLLDLRTAIAGKSRVTGDLTRLDTRIRFQGGRSNGRSTVSADFAGLRGAARGKGTISATNLGGTKTFYQGRSRAFAWVKGRLNPDVPDLGFTGFNVLGALYGAGGPAYALGYYVGPAVPYTDLITLEPREPRPPHTLWGLGFFYVDPPSQWIRNPGDTFPVFGRWEQHTAHSGGSVVLDPSAPVEAECHIKVRIRTVLNPRIENRYKSLQVYPASDLVLAPPASQQLWPDQQTIWRLDASYESR